MNLPFFFHSHPPLPVSTSLQLLVSPVAGTGERGEHTHAPSGGSGASPTDVRRAELQLGKVPWILWRQVAHQLPHSSWDDGGTGGFPRFREKYRKVIRIVKGLGDLNAMLSQVWMFNLFKGTSLPGRNSLFLFLFCFSFSKFTFF